MAEKRLTRKHLMITSLKCKDQTSNRVRNAYPFKVLRKACNKSSETVELSQVRASREWQSLGLMVGRTLSVGSYGDP